jgi:plastocyanin
MDRSAMAPSILFALILATVYSTERALLVGRIVTLESERESLHGRVDLLERAFTGLLAQPGAAALPARRLEEHGISDHRATVHIDAPDGVSEVVLGGEDAEDNVILSKAHLNEGAEFTISRNETSVLSIGVNGALSVLADPLQVASAVSSAQGAPLELRSSAGDGVALQDQQPRQVSEVDGSTAWSSLNVLAYTGDTVHWSWTNYHNVVEINDAGIIVSGGIRSGDPVLASSYAYTFSRAGVYLFKSQAADTMRMTVEVREFAVRNGTMFVGGDLEVGGEGSAVSNGTLRVGGSLEVSGVQVSGPGFAQEVRLFLGGACPPGWVEASETMGKLLASRGVSEDAGSSKSKAGISATYRNYRSTYEMQATMTAPDSFVLLLCKPA